jgi:hypothetical protein
MTFDAPFRRTFRPPFGPALSTANPWWLSGGIAAANCIAAYQPKGAASLAASYINLANPGTYNITLGSAPNWNTITGWIGILNTSWMKTGIIPGVNWSIAIRFSNPTTTYPISGCRYAYIDSEFGVSYRAIEGILYRHQSQKFVLPAITSGVFVVAGQNGYRNGNLDTNAIPTATNTAWQELYIQAENRAGTVSGKGGCDIQAVAVFNITIDGAQELALSTAMAAL